MSCPVFVSDELFALALVAQHDADDQNLPGECKSRLERFSSLVGILDHVQHEAEVHDVGRLPFGIRAKDGIPTACGYVQLREQAQVIASTTAVVEQRLRTVQEAEPQQMLHGGR